MSICAAIDWPLEGSARVAGHTDLKKKSEAERAREAREWSAAFFLVVELEGSAAECVTKGPTEGSP